MSILEELNLWAYVAVQPSLFCSFAYGPDFMKQFFLLTVIAISQISLAQNLINQNYSEAVLGEDFNDQNDIWQYPTSYENLFILDKGQYFLTRQNPSSAYAIMAKWPNNLTRFNIKTSLILGPAETKEQTIGVIFLIQDEGKGAVVFEINKDREYRVKEMVGAYYKYITGDKASAGWVKSKAIDTKENNKIDIKVYDRQCDFYINGQFLTSFNVPEEYGPGRLGLIIGPSAKAKVDYYYVYTTSEGAEELGPVEKTMSPEERIMELSQENLDLKRQLAEVNVDQIKAEADQIIALLEERLEIANQSVELLEVENQQLKQYKNEVLTDMDEDVFLTLSQSLKDEIKKNQALQGEIEFLNDSIKAIHASFQDFKLKLLDQAIKEKEKELKNKPKEEPKPELPKKEEKALEKAPEKDPEKKIEDELEVPKDSVSTPVEVKATEGEDVKPVEGTTTNEWDASDLTDQIEVLSKPKTPEEYEDKPSIESSKQAVKPEPRRVRTAVKREE